METKRKHSYIDRPNKIVNAIACISTIFTMIPLVGFVYFVGWKDYKPGAANSAMLWSGIGMILFVVFFFIGWFFSIPFIPFSR